MLTSITPDETQQDEAPPQAPTLTSITPDDDAPSPQATSASPAQQEFQDRLQRVVQRMADEGHPIRITSGQRSSAQQAQLYAQGRTAPGPIVTDANGTTTPSAHQSGTAADVTFVVNGQPQAPDPSQPWDRLAKIAGDEGLVWGGSFKSFPDRPHLQLSTPKGLTSITPDEPAAPTPAPTALGGLAHVATDLVTRPFANDEPSWTKWPVMDAVSALVSAGYQMGKDQVVSAAEGVGQMFTAAEAWGKPLGRLLGVTPNAPLTGQMTPDIPARIGVPKAPIAPPKTPRIGAAPADQWAMNWKTQRTQQQAAQEAQAHPDPFGTAADLVEGAFKAGQIPGALLGLKDPVAMMRVLGGAAAADQLATMIQNHVQMPSNVARFLHAAAQLTGGVAGAEAPRIGAAIASRDLGYQSALGTLGLTPDDLSGLSSEEAANRATKAFGDQAQQVKSQIDAAQQANQAAPQTVVDRANALTGAYNWLSEHSPFASRLAHGAATALRAFGLISEAPEAAVAPQAPSAPQIELPPPEAEAAPAQPPEPPPAAPAPEPEPAPSAGVPFVMTQDMVSRLRSLGYDDQEIGAMTPQQAHDFLQDATPEPTPVPSPSEDEIVQRMMDDLGVVKPTQAPVQPAPVEDPYHLTFVRHGETAANKGNESQEALRGWRNYPLTDQGRADAEAAGQALAKVNDTTPFDRIVSSDLDRAHETANIISKATGVPVTVDPNLRPWNVGDLAGKPIVEVKQQMLDLVAHPDEPAPGGESFNQFLARYVPAIQAIHADPRRTIVVAHTRNAMVLHGLASTGGQSVDDAYLKRKHELNPGAIMTVSPDWKVGIANDMHVLPTVAAAKPVSVASVAEMQPGGYYLVDPTLLKSDAPRFQYKGNANEQGITAEDFIEGPWDENKSGVLQVWKDPADGQIYVTNGNHRREAAIRLGAPRVLAKVSAQPTAELARLEAALINIADDKGTAMDAAKVFRALGTNAREIKDVAHLNPRKRVTREGLALSKLSDPIFTAVATGELPEPTGIAIGESGLDEAGQMAVVKLIERQRAKGRELTPGQLGQLIRNVQNEPSVQAGGQQKDIWEILGETRETNIAVEKAVLADWLSTKFGQDKRLWGSVAAESKAGKLAEGGNVINAAGNKARADLAATRKAYFDELANKQGPISTALTQAAIRAVNGENDRAVKADLEAAVNAALDQESRAAVPAAEPPRAPERPAVGGEPGPPGVHPPAVADVAKDPLDAELDSLFDDLSKPPSNLLQAAEGAPRLNPDTLAKVQRIVDIFRAKGLVAARDIEAAALERMGDQGAAYLPYLQAVLAPPAPPATAPSQIQKPAGGLTPDTPIGFGKYAQTPIKDVPPSYLDWLFENGTWKGAQRVIEYLKQDPAFMARRTAKPTLDARETLTPEALQIFKTLGLNAEPRSDGTIQLGGKTYDRRDVIKAHGGRWDGEVQAWRVPADRVAGLVDDLRGPAAALGQRRAPEAPYVSDPRLRALRDAADRTPDVSRLERPAGSLVQPSTIALIERGLTIGMPESVVAEQIEDVALIHRAWDTGEPLFLLASEPGSGKTFVLGGAIRELRQAGAKTFVYVTMNEGLIGQIQRDLADYDIGNVHFVTYAKLAKVESKPSDVLIFDEAHSIKNVGLSGLPAAVAKAGADWIERAKFRIFASATPFEKPTEAKYLDPTGIFTKEPFKTFIEYATAFGASQRTVGENATVWWNPTPTSHLDAAASRGWLARQGTFTSRRIRLKPGAADSRLVKIDVADADVRRYQALLQAATEKEDFLPGNSRAWIVNFQKRLLEASKVQTAIGEARSALDRGRFPIIFVETKAERILDIPDLIRREEAWAIAAAQASAMREAPPKRSEFGLPPPGITDVLGRYMDLTGEGTINIPSAEDLVKEAFPGQVAIYTGSVSDSRAQKNLVAWREGELPVLVATMAKGGTGLSLHDKIGDHQTTQINLNLPWTATKVVQVTQRSARYGLVGQAEIEWLFADNIPFDRDLAGKVGQRMADMGASVHGEKLPSSTEIQDWNLQDVPFSEMSKGLPLKQEDEDLRDTGNYISAEDILATGERQPRLPGDVGAVREQEIATPQLHLPYSRDALKAVFKFTDEQADAVHALIQATGVPTSDLSLTRQGRNGQPAVSAGPQNLFQMPENVGRLSRWYYSNTEKALETWQRKGTADQLLAHLKKFKGAMEEAEAIGLPAWLAEHPSVTRDEVQQYLNQHQIVVTERRLGEDTDLAGALAKASETPHFKSDLAVIQRAGLDVGIDRYGEISLMEPGEAGGEPVGRLDLPDDVLDAMGRISDQVGRFYGEQPTKYGQYQTPGGTNYRELLLTLPRSQPAEGFEEWQKQRGYYPTENEGELAARMLTYRGVGATEQSFKSSHWDEPNVIAHVRMNDRVIDREVFIVRNTSSGHRSDFFTTKADAEAYQSKLPEAVRDQTEIVPVSRLQHTLFVEEVQSDWARELRKNPPANVRAITELPPQFAVQPATGRHGWIVTGPGAGAYTNGIASDTREQAIADFLHAFNAIEGRQHANVPLMPFGKSWTNLAMKRILAYAAEHGYDAIAWTTGEAQRKRYDLAKQVDKIEWANGTVAVHVKGGSIITFDTADGKVTKARNRMADALVGKPVEDVVGKDITKQIAATSIGKVEGEGLKIGGAWALNLYDKQVPSIMDGLLKKYGSKTHESSLHGAVEPWMWPHHYEGPDPSISDLQALLARSRLMGDEQINGEYVRRAAVTSELQQIIADVEAGQPMRDRLSESSRSMVRILGGDLVKDKAGPPPEPIHVIDLTREAREAIVKDGVPLFQGEKGMADFADDGRALITAFETADVSTALHEFFHVERRRLLNRDVPPEQRAGITDDDITAIEEWAGVKDGKWDREAEEKYARARERYVYDGKAPTRKLQAIFDKLAAWMRQVYQSIKNSSIDLHIPDAIRAIFDKISARVEFLEAEQARAAEAGKRPPTMEELRAQRPTVKDTTTELPFDRAPEGMLFQAAEERPKAWQERELRDVAQFAQKQMAMGVGYDDARAALTEKYGQDATRLMPAFNSAWKAIGGRFEAAPAEHEMRVPEAVKEAAKTQWQGAVSIQKDLTRNFAPAHIGDASQFTAERLREDLAKMAHHDERARHILEAAWQVAQKMSVDHDMVVRIANQFEDPETYGEPPAEYKAIYDLVQSLYAPLKKEIDRLGHGLAWKEYFWAHPPWVQPNQTLAAQVGQRLMGRRPLTGPKGFLHQRTFPTVGDGIAAGWTVPENGWNFIDWQFWKLDEMRKAVMGWSHAEASKALPVEQGGWKFVSSLKGRPNGLQPIPDPIGTVWLPPNVTFRETFYQHRMDRIEQLVRSLGVSYRRTSPANKGVGSMNTETGAVKARVGTPEAVLFHELGHVLDFKYPDFSSAMRGKVIREELTALAKLRYEGQTPTDAYQAYVKTPAERLANLVHAFIDAPDRARQVAPTAMAAFDQFLDAHPELADIRELRDEQTLVLGERPVTVQLAGPVKVGQYYALPEVVKIYENYLSPSLASKSTTFRAIRALQTTSVRMILSLSGFHVGTIGTVAISQGLEAGLAKIAAGKIDEGIKMLATAAARPITMWAEGRKIAKRYYATDPSSLGADYALKLLIAAGGRVGVDRKYFQGAWRQSQKSWLRMKGALERDMTAVAGKEFAKAAIQAIPATLFTVTDVIMRQYVPYVKLAALIERAKMMMDHLPPDTELTPETLRHIAAKAGDITDDVYGMVVHENWMWPRWQKELMQGMFLAWGWTGGELRLLGGAAGEALAPVLRAVGRRLPGGGGAIPPGKPPVGMRFAGKDDEGNPRYEPVYGRFFGLRLGAILGLMIGTYLVATFIQGMTGQGELKDIEDYVAPRLGGTNPDGTPRRGKMWAYMPDFYSFVNNPIATLLHKLNPGIGMVNELYNNVDFYGDEIVDPNDPLSQKMQDWAAYILKRLYEPISFSSYAREHSPLAGLGLSAPSRSLTATSAERMLHDAEGTPFYTKVEARAYQWEQEWKDAQQKGDQAAAQAAASHLTRQELASVERQTNRAPQDAQTWLERHFAVKRAGDHLDLKTAMRVYEAATPEERARIWPMMQQRYNQGIGRSATADVDALRREWATVQTLPRQ